MITQSLNQCRWCKDTNIIKFFESKPLPTNIWPIARSSERRFEKASVYLCNKCGHIQLQDMDESFVASLYEGYDFIIDNPEIKKKRASIILKHLNFNEGHELPRVLDLGGGVNSIHNYLDRTKYNAEAIDFAISEETKSICKKVYQGDVTVFEFDCKFDCIVSYHCLEHFNKTREAFQKIYNILTDDGLFIFEVPDNSEVLLNNHTYMLFHQHLNLYNENFLSVALQKIGFKILEIIKFGTTITYVLKKEILNKDIIIKYNVSESMALLNKLASVIERTDKGVDSLLSNLSNKKVGFYGAGGTTALFLATYDKLGAIIREIFDRDTVKHGKYILKSNLRVKSPKEIERSNLDCLLFLQHDVYKIVSKDIRNIECIDISNLLLENK